MSASFSFELGYNLVKRAGRVAMAEDVSRGSSSVSDLLNWIKLQYRTNHFDEKSSLKNSLLGGAFGAGLGGLVGAGAGMIDKKDDEESRLRHVIKRIMQSGAIGAAGGGLYGYGKSKGF